jgi:hypothetical protein
MYAASRRTSSQTRIFVVMGEKNKEFLIFIYIYIYIYKRIELLPSILVTGNSNWFQSLDKRTDCV